MLWKHKLLMPEWNFCSPWSWAHLVALYKRKYTEFIVQIPFWTYLGSGITWCVSKHIDHMALVIRAFTVSEAAGNLNLTYLFILLLDPLTEFLLFCNLGIVFTLFWSMDFQTSCWFCKFSNATALSKFLSCCNQILYLKD